MNLTTNVRVSVHADKLINHSALKALLVEIQVSHRAAYAVDSASLYERLSRRAQQPRNIPQIRTVEETRAVVQGTQPRELVRRARYLERLGGVYRVVDDNVVAHIDARGRPT